MRYAGAFAAVLGLGVTLAWAGLMGAGPVVALAGLWLLPAAVAVWGAASGWPRGFGLTAAAAGGAFLGSGSWVAAAFYGLTAALGLLLSLGFRRRWTYGRCVALVAIPAYLFVAGGVLATWEESRTFAAEFLNGQLEVLRRQAGVLPETEPARPAAEEAETPVSPTVEESQETAAPASGASQAARDASVPGLAETARFLRWMQEHWEAINLGLALWPVLLSALFVVSFSARWLRVRGGGSVFCGSFRDLRPPDWLVWLAILAALALFAERRWPNSLLRNVSWNAAIGLAAVYWVNGMAVLVYALSAIRLHVFLAAAVFLGIAVYPGAHAVFCGVGFFDTWAEFRPRLRRAIAARRARQREENEDDED